MCAYTYLFVESCFVGENSTPDKTQEERIKEYTVCMRAR